MFWAGVKSLSTRQKNRSLQKSGQIGLSMPEMLVVLALLAILLVLALVFFRSSLGRSRDAERKSDLERIKVAFEDYHNDTGCYPDSTVLQYCNQSTFRPYLDKVPCDPLTGDPYYYVPLPDSCKGYRVFTALEDQKDPVIGQLNCDTSYGCGPGEAYNYGISAGASVSTGQPIPAPSGGAVSPSPSSAPTSPSPAVSSTPSPSPIFVYACDAAGTCNRYEDGHPYLVNCPVTFPQSNCNNACGDPANRCGG